MIILNPVAANYHTIRGFTIILNAVVILALGNMGVGESTSPTIVTQAVVAKWVTLAATVMLSTVVVGVDVIRRIVVLPKIQSLGFYGVFP